MSELPVSELGLDPETEFLLRSIMFFEPVSQVRRLIRLARVRSFSQDDAHIFCMPEQLQEEIQAFVQLVHEVYHAFDFDRVDVKLATRPAKRIGTDEQWDKGEKALSEALYLSRPAVCSDGVGTCYDLIEDGRNGFEHSK